MRLKFRTYNAYTKTILEFEDGTKSPNITTEYANEKCDVGPQDMIDYLEYNGNFDYTVEGEQWIRNFMKDLFDDDRVEIVKCITPGQEDYIKITLLGLDLFERNQLF